MNIDDIYIGQKLECIKNIGLEDELTEFRFYEVEDIDNNHGICSVLISNDYLEYEWYCLDRFNCIDCKTRKVYNNSGFKKFIESIEKKGYKK